MLHRPLQAFLLTLIFGTFAGCDSAGGGGGQRSCVDLCSEAQAGDCTAITGDCGDFCAALEAVKVESRAGCDAEADAYATCESSQANVCDPPGCGTEEQALIDCMQPYCLANLDDPDCMALIASYA